MTILDTLKTLQNQINQLNAKVKDLSAHTEEKARNPFSVVGGGQGVSSNRPIDIRSGRGTNAGGPVLWNNTEINGAYGYEPAIPSIGYNKHSHSRYSGGALIKDVLEIVEYDWGSITNKHSQQFLTSYRQPQIVTEENSSGQSVQKIGLLDLIFNADTGKWGVSTLEIDIKKCNFVEKDDDNNIIHSAPLYNEDSNKTSIIWDENGDCWRFYSVYASGE